jgi:hypothetical protein
LSAAGKNPPAKDGDVSPRPGNRELIRPRLEQHEHWPGTKPERRRRSTAPIDDTGAEAEHFHKQVKLGTKLVVTMEDGTVHTGVIEWHDRDCFKLRPVEGPGVIIFKQAVLHSVRDGNAAASRDARGRRV